jgi:hypothetical protein
MRVVREDDVGAGVHGRLALIGLEGAGRALVLEVPVPADDDEVSLLRGVADVGLDGSDVGATRRGARARRRRRVACREHVGEAEERRLRGALAEDLAGLRLLDGLAGADHGDAGLLAVLERIEKAGVAHVAGVVVGHGHHVDAAPGHSLGQRRVALDDHVLPALRVAAGGER